MTNLERISRHKEQSHRELARLPFSEKVKMVIANQKIMDVFRKARMKESGK